jgi:hypothetical protein
VRGQMTQALYAHMSNKTIKIKKKKDLEFKPQYHLGFPVTYTVHTAASLSSNSSLLCDCGYISNPQNHLTQ